MPIKSLVVVGGGSAGWIAAGILAADHPPTAVGGIQVTLIESPDVPTIGVGEGTWPSMRETLARIGLSEAEFLVACESSFKQGSKFVGWLNGEGKDQYYHPFMIPEGYYDFNVGDVWPLLNTHKQFADVVCPQPLMCEQGRAPKPIVAEEYTGVLNYGYHLNAGLFSEILKRHCIEKLGVRYICDNVVGVVSSENGNIASLKTVKSGDIAADFFVDCSGFKSLLINEHYKIPFLCTKHILFNDAALAVQVPYAHQSSPIASATVSTAQKAGWIWDIGLSSRRGVGHVYSTAHSNPDEVEASLMRYLSGTLSSDVVKTLEPRTIKFAPGYREKFWHKNCVAIGMAAGFIEPLEASALALVELSAKMISEELPFTHHTMEAIEHRFNEKFRYRWERVIEFLKLHYVLSQRTDPYWIDARSTGLQSSRLGSLLELWKFRAPNRNDFFHYDEIFPVASYLYILYGMGFKPSLAGVGSATRSLPRARKLFEENSRACSRLTSFLPSNRELLNAIADHVNKNRLTAVAR